MEMKWMSFSLPVGLSASASLSLATVMALSLVSCDEAKELYQTAIDKVKELKDGESSDGEALVSDVTSVNEVDGKAIIQSERRLVMVEFYSDT